MAKKLEKFALVMLSFMGTSMAMEEVKPAEVDIFRGLDTNNTYHSDAKKILNFITADDYTLGVQGIESNDSNERLLKKTYGIEKDGWWPESVQTNLKSRLVSYLADNENKMIDPEEFCLAHDTAVSSNIWSGFFKNYSTSKIKLSDAPAGRKVIQALYRAQKKNGATIIEENDWDVSKYKGLTFARMQAKWYLRLTCSYLRDLPDDKLFKDIS